jgi:rhodanese-related sulfurtransferase
MRKLAMDTGATDAGATDTSATGTRTIETILTAARARLRRVGPREARAAWREGALLIDIRPDEQRRREGEIPGVLKIERNVLEWRLDPASPDRMAEITSHAQPVILICQEGYASSLAAASLQDLGLVNATDLEGGIAAWAAAGLPFRKGRPQRVSDAARPVRGSSPRRAAFGGRTRAFHHGCRFC